MDTDRYKNRYRIPSSRLQSWDYGWNSAYFVTICTKEMLCCFGNIVWVHSGVAVETQDLASLPRASQKIRPEQEIRSSEETTALPQQKRPKMQLSQTGQIANECWLQIPEHFPFVKLGNHIVMPNHVHGIVIISKKDDDCGCCDPFGYEECTDVETQDLASLPRTSQRVQPENIKHMNQFGPQSRNLASIIRGFKAGVTKKARCINPGFSWQSRFYDHIIRNDQSFQRISDYIESNVVNWEKDEFYKSEGD